MARSPAAAAALTFGAAVGLHAPKVWRVIIVAAAASTASATAAATDAGWGVDSGVVGRPPAPRHAPRRDARALLPLRSAHVVHRLQLGHKRLAPLLAPLLALAPSDLARRQLAGRMPAAAPLTCRLPRRLPRQLPRATPLVAASHCHGDRRMATARIAAQRVASVRRGQRRGLLLVVASLP